MHAPCAMKLSYCSLAWVAVLFSVSTHSLLTFSPCERLGDTAVPHMAALFLPQTKGRLCVFGALQCVPSKRFLKKMVWTPVSGEMAPPVPKGDGDSLQ